jgi:hypothetical protein
VPQTQPGPRPLFIDIAIACYANYRADERKSTTAEDGDKALLDAAYMTDLLLRPDLRDYVAALHEKLKDKLAAAPSLKMPGEARPPQPRPGLGAPIRVGA